MPTTAERRAARAASATPVPEAASTQATDAVAVILDAEAIDAADRAAATALDEAGAAAARAEAEHRAYINSLPPEHEHVLLDQGRRLVNPGPPEPRPDDATVAHATPDPSEED